MTTDEHAPGYHVILDGEVVTVRWDQVRLPGIIQDHIT